MVGERKILGHGEELGAVSIKSQAVIHNQAQVSPEVGKGRVAVGLGRSAHCSEVHRIRNQYGVARGL